MKSEGRMESDLFRNLNHEIHEIHERPSCTRLGDFVCFVYFVVISLPRFIRVTGLRIALVTRHSDFGFRPSFGLRPSAFGLS